MKRTNKESQLLGRMLVDTCKHAYLHGSTQDELAYQVKNKSLAKGVNVME